MATTGDAELVLGIDVSKGWLDIARHPDGAAWRVANTAAGWAELVAELPPQAPVRIVLEASGGYEVGVVMALNAVGRPPVVVNPLVMRRYAQSCGNQAKTDRIDAGVLARFGAERRPVPRPIPSELARDLAALLAEREAMTKQVVECKNRRQQARPILWERLDVQLAWLLAQRASVDAHLAELVASDPGWAARVAVLRSVPGIGILTATILAVGVPELGQATGKQVAALVGVAPFANESGRRERPRQIAGGRRHVRRALYQAMLSIKQWDPTIRAHYAHLRSVGKPAKVAIVACMRRLLGLLTAMVRDGLTWPQLQVHTPAIHPIAA